MEPTPHYLVLDGGFGTEVACSHGQRGVDGHRLWSSKLLATDPELIRNIHESFLEAGSDVIQTNTYQASVQGFVEHLGLSETESVDLMASSVRLAKDAVDAFWNAHPELHQVRRRPLVAGSVGPYGAYLEGCAEYSGTYVDTMTTDDLKDWHRPRLRALLAAGVDLVAMETIPAEKEVLALMELLREFPDAKAWITVTCKDGEHTRHGERVADVLPLTLRCDQVVATGFNCGAPQHVESLLRQVPAEVRSRKRIVVYPNSGEAWSKESKWCGSKDSRSLHTYVPRWVELGAGWVGGCCRITPRDISNVRAVLRRWITNP